MIAYDNEFDTRINQGTSINLNCNFSDTLVWSWLPNCKSDDNSNKFLRFANDSIKDKMSNLRNLLESPLDNTML